MSPNKQCYFKAKTYAFLTELTTINGNSRDWINEKLVRVEYCQRNQVLLLYFDIHWNQYKLMSKKPTGTKYFNQKKSEQR